MERGREVRKGIAAKNLYILLYSYSLYYWGLNIHVCVLFSFLFSFILYSCLYVNVYITLCLFYTLLFLFYFNFFLILWYFLNFEMLCFVFISVLLTSCIFIAKSYFNMKYQQTINQQTTRMTPNPSCMNLMLYYDVRWHYNRINCCSR